MILLTYGILSFCNILSFIVLSIFYPPQPPALAGQALPGRGFFGPSPHLPLSPSFFGCRSLLATEALAKVAGRRLPLFEQIFNHHRVQLLQSDTASLCLFRNKTLICHARDSIYFQEIRSVADNNKIDSHNSPAAEKVINF